MNALFTTAMALREVEAPAGGQCRIFDGELDEHWTIGPKVHGGVMLALCAKAARAAHGGDALQPVAVSTNFLWAPDPGPMRLVTSIRKRGRRISVVDVELMQGERTAVHAVVTLGEPEHYESGPATPLLSANPVLEMMAPNRQTMPHRSAPVMRWPVWPTWVPAAMCGPWRRRCRPRRAGGADGRRPFRCGPGHVASPRTHCSPSCAAICRSRSPLPSDAPVGRPPSS
ncbi:hypothetical protein NJB1728216S_19990 [Mycobacterium marinum]|nr:hypothetical protein NJB1907f34b_30320 [Mycobacterium marinum]GJO25752.1 hypothetical protein NJB1728e18_33050 [Mycobacterium marinum]GJO41912.1 hypothetical protein NJB1728e24_24940 [Mycobacterium marinum]GJO66828.1 hypothetical protein NJB1728216S_19990 [Mycobacterium marinum]GJO68692.1 hypothetical protein NJB1728f10_40400 [Mycobacterium marinum]